MELEPVKWHRREERRAFVVEMASKGFTDQQISNVLGISNNIVQNDLSYDNNLPNKTIVYVVGSQQLPWDCQDRNICQPQQKS